MKRMDNKIDLGNGFVMLQFEDAAQPVFLEKKGKPYVYYGEKNDYPNYLLYLYNNSSKHSGIINGKVDYIMGKGFKFDEEGITEQQKTTANAFLKRANAKGETLRQVFEKCLLDFEIFNGAYLQIVWTSSSEKMGSIYHLDYTSVRSNADNSEFYVSDEWVKYLPDGSYKINNNPKYDPYPAFNPDKKTGTQILYIKKYHPGIDIYTLPAYRGSITWIEVDVEIGFYHLNNVKGGFFVNKLINFNNGVPTEDAQKEIEKMFDRKFGGVRGRKYMLAFNHNKENAATVEDLSVAESDKLFDWLGKTAEQHIFTGHRVTSPMLFGIKTEGQLGGRSEFRDAFEIFQNTFVNGRQEYWEEIFNTLAGYIGVQVPLFIQKTEPIGFAFGENVIANNLTRDEIREYISDKLSIKLKAEPAPPAQQFSVDERDVAVFSEYGSPRKGLKVLKSKQVLFTNDEEEAQHFANEEAQITKVHEGIIDLLSKDPFTTQEIIAEALGVDVELIQEAIRELEKSGLLKVSEKKRGEDVVVERRPATEAKRIIKDRNPVTRSVQIMYSYEGPQDDRNRPFCAKMLELDRLYSRKDIEKISARLGYSVWSRRGGWYTIPGTNEHRPYCRHSWASNVVVKNVGDE